MINNLVLVSAAATTYLYKNDVRTTLGKGYRHCLPDPPRATCDQCGAVF
jgi:hypothetical protein